MHERNQSRDEFPAPTAANPHHSPNPCVRKSVFTPCVCCFPPQSNFLSMPRSRSPGERRATSWNGRDTAFLSQWCHPSGLDLRRWSQCVSAVHCLGKMWGTKWHILVFVGFRAGVGWKRPWHCDCLFSFHSAYASNNCNLTVAHGASIGSCYLRTALSAHFTLYQDLCKSLLEKAQISCPISLQHSVLNMEEYHQHWT